MEWKRADASVLDRPAPLTPEQRARLAADRGITKAIHAVIAEHDTVLRVSLGRGETPESFRADLARVRADLVMGGVPDAYHVGVISRGDRLFLAWRDTRPGRRPRKAA